MFTVGLLGSIPFPGLLSYYEPVRLPHCPETVIYSRSPLRTSPPAMRVSQVPRLTFPHAPSPLTPASPPGSLARCSPDGGRLRHIRKVGQLAVCVTRPKRVRLRYGSRVRRTGLQRRDYSRTLPDCLHGERAIAMVTSFQVTRSVRLILTHRRTL